MTISDDTRAANPQMSDEFARVYEESAHRITGPISLAALDMTGGIGPGTRWLDIAAGPAHSACRQQSAAPPSWLLTLRPEW